MNTSPKKPSPLSYGSPRTSPFKRPESPQSQSPSAPTARAATPQSPSRQLPPPQQPHSPSPAALPSSPTLTPQTQRLQPASPYTQRPSSPASNNSTPRRGHALNGDPLSKLHPSQVREMRECFQVLDRDNDGQVTREDVADILNELGMESSNSTLSQYLPPSGHPSLNLATYLSTIASLCAPLSRPDELTAAFAAFDVDDSGQIDLDELRDALLNTAPERGERALSGREIDSVVDGFTARRAFGKNSGATSKPRGEVFRYLDFVGTLNGKTDEQQAKPNVAVPA